MNVGEMDLNASTVEERIVRNVNGKLSCKWNGLVCIFL